ncbi:hypothetical protein KL927_004014 [Ogataea polymorpha]|nr:hypothetical protein KL927_004014 [Ogataea polymorpha]
MKGSPFGICTDARGSIRLPESSNGVYGYMTSPRKITNRGIGHDKSKPSSWVKSQIDPVSGDLNSIALWLKVMIKTNMSSMYSLAAVYSCLGYPAGIMPVTKIDLTKYQPVPCSKFDPDLRVKGYPYDFYEGISKKSDTLMQKHLKKRWFAFRLLTPGSRTRGYCKL